MLPQILVYTLHMFVCVQSLSMLGLIAEYLQTEFGGRARWGATFGGYPVRP